MILIDSFYETSNKTVVNKFFDVLKDAKTKIIFTYSKGIKIPIVTKEIYLTYPSKIEKEIIIKNILKAEEKNLSVEIINYISEQINLSVREIEGLIICILAKEALGHFNADIELVKDIHNRMISSN